MTNDKPFSRMNEAEKDALAKRLDKGIDFSDTRPLSAKGKLLWKMAKRGRPRKLPRERAARVLITIEPRLLERADRLAREKGISRSEFIAEGIRHMLVATDAA